MWWAVGPHLKRRMAQERGETNKPRQHCTFFDGATGKDDFLEVLRRKYGTLTRAWRIALDDDESGLLDSREFYGAMDKIGFIGNTRSLWFNLDQNQSGYVSLVEIDPVAAQALEKFRARCCKTFGSMDAAWEECLDRDRSGWLTLPELEDASLELGYSDMNEVENLFNLLLIDPSSFRIPAHEVLFLQKWEERKQRTLSRSWRRGARWVNKDPYFGKETAQTARPRLDTVPGVPAQTPTPPETPEPDDGRVAAAYLQSKQIQEKIALDPRRSAARKTAHWEATLTEVPISDDPDFSKKSRMAIGLRRSHTRESVTTTRADCDDDEVLSEDLASDVTDYTDIVATDKEKAWLDFESYLVSTFGSMVKAFDTMDKDGNGAIEREEWMQTVTRTLRYCRASEAVRLFESRIRANKSQRITYQDLGITNQEWIVHTHHRRMELQAKQHRNLQMKPQAFGGQGLRRELAAKDHEGRMKCPPKKPQQAFWKTLPGGWGKPPSFINFIAATEDCHGINSGRRRRSGLLSARSAVKPTPAATAEPAFSAW